MQAFDQAPPSPKEMFRFYAKRRRLPRWSRVLIAVGVIGIIYLITVEAVHPPAWAGDVSSGLRSRSQTAKAARAPGSRLRDGDGTVKPRADQILLTDEDEDEVPRSSKSKTNRDGRKNKLAAEKEERLVARPGKVGSSKQTPAGSFIVDSKLEQGLKYIFSVMPDELHLRELLRPIENSGKERMRELGLRARQFRTMLNSWEAIHLVHTEDSTLVRDDIIPYLSQVKETTGIDPTKARADLIRSYENFRYFLTKLSDLLFPWTAPYFADHMTLHASIKHGGRGIVLSGGDGQLKYMMTSIRSIRKLGCDLPIEVMYLGDDDLEDDSRTELENEPGVITRDMKQMVHDEGWDLRGWAGKPFAILLSSFREVIFIDADAMFFVSPETLFDDPAYKETGTLFFRDRLMFPENKRKWLQQILPKPMSKNVRESRFWTGQSGHMQESGVVLVDKWRHFMAMLMVTRMNGPDRDGDSDRGIVGTYDMVYGDKETFWLGWELVGDTDYAFHPGDAGNMGVAKEDYEEARRHVLGGIEDAMKQAREDQEQRQREEQRRHDEEQARRKEQAANEGRQRIAEEQAAAAAAEKVNAEKAENAQEKEKESSMGAGKGRKYDAPPSPDDGEVEGDQSVDNADTTEETPTSPAEAQPDGPAARKVRRALDEEDEELAPSYLASSTTNWTICAPQLLHLDRNNRPLWFNGWILDNKFDAEHSKVSNFERFMVERKKGATEADWKLEENNLCCLRSDEVYEFTKLEKQALTNIVSIAKRVGALGRK